MAQHYEQELMPVCVLLNKDAGKDICALAALLSHASRETHSLCYTVVLMAGAALPIFINSPTSEKS